MNIVVCIKQVPAVSSVKIDPESKRLVRNGVKATLNPFDYYALEVALQLKERYGGNVTALSMGPAKAEEILYEALALGCDRAVLLSDRKFAGSDTWATSYILAEGIRKLEDIDIVICGKQAIDGDTAQVAPGIAAHLDWSQACEVEEIGEVEKGDNIVIVRNNGSCSERIRTELPCVLAVADKINRPRIPTLRGWLQAVEDKIISWNVEVLGLQDKYIGLQGSPTRVVATEAPTMADKETLLIENNRDSAVAAIIDIIKEVENVC